MKSIAALLWVDVETTTLPDGNDFSGVDILEISVIITDLDLNKIAGYSEVIKMTKQGAEALKKNDYVRKMHKENGLIADSLKSEVTVAEAEQQIIEMIKHDTTYDPGEFAIAGSGVAAFDFPLLKYHMPKLVKFLAYYPYDSGIFRRMLKLSARDFVVPTISKSSGDEKDHRSLADVTAHIEEMRGFQDWFKEIKEMTDG